MHKTKIRQLVSRKVISVTPETSAAEAVAVMSRSRISCLVVAKGRKPVGIFTERDVVRFANQGTAFAAEPISTLMTSPVVTISG
ncbi:MAG TPA: CBS domain-containing protein, partial [Geobacteraceae bacterium]